MNLKINGLNFDVTDAIRERVTGKLERVAHHHDGVISITVTVSVEKVHNKAAAQVHMAGKDLYIEETAPDMYAAIDVLVDKLDRAILQYKEKNQHR